MTRTIREELAQDHDFVASLTGRAFQATKSRAHPSIPYAGQCDGRGTLVLVDRSYRPLGHQGFADYADPKFDHLRFDDTAEVRLLAVSINENGNSNFPVGEPGPILVFLAHNDSRDSYCRRLQALLKVVR